jgi:hypothetical protein
VCKNLNRFVFALKRLRDTVSAEAALMAYHLFIYIDIQFNSITAYAKALVNLNY